MTAGRHKLGKWESGLAASLPVIEYAKEPGSAARAALPGTGYFPIWGYYHLKTGLGRLSAYCGAVSAGSGAVTASHG